jgi:hypothetical protein
MMVNAAIRSGPAAFGGGGSGLLIARGRDGQRGRFHVECGLHRGQFWVVGG